ncbi:MAG TPA: glycerol-3-phosphate dehydrogenase/oxidase [Hydrogenophaga sp.]|uniref:glycerol-3-phosphate dehydrogenase/oxidase n=1 Tax=Hydrogenophaga sp. TaxID=1904254 RepID=UPI002D1CDD14|nr:glycerol-3-phosphate dehydrogenase/oxidase [Hydrogenophaga sp.]HSX94329.1 glycerol-3-phosphate dehydrogenase/oxidase [Hydrogenophaga sp.]
MNREQRFASLADTDRFDLVVVGGGATGLGVALDASLRGFSVALFESHDFAGGTSSRATKLLHGGVRYLAQGNVALVREALAERTTVMAIAPHLAQPLPFVMPSHQWWQTPFYGIGLKLYDLLAGRAGLGPTEFLDRARTLSALPGVNPQGLRGGVRYWDGQFDDARLAIALARTAEAAGAFMFNHAEVVAIAPDGDGHAVTVCDRVSGGQRRVRARCVVNATGVWVDAIREAAGTPSHMVSPSQGVHVVVDREFLGGEHALLVPRTRDGRVLFAVPWLGKLILGTTDTPRQDLAREPQPFEQELAFILDEASRALSRPVRHADIRSVWVGLRPLVAAPSDGSGTKGLSREHTVVVDPNGLVTVTGGKWTTYRAMAEDVLQRCMDAGRLPARAGGQSARRRLVGAPASASVPIHAAPGWHLYGTEAQQIQALPGADRILGLGLCAAMVRFAVRCEYALTVEDVLARRWRALFLDAVQAGRMAAEVADILREEGVSDPRTDDFMDLSRRYAAPDV